MMKQFQIAIDSMCVAAILSAGAPVQCWADNGRNCNMYESAGQYGENKNPKGKINFKTK